MTKYRMKIYRPGEVLWQTHDVRALDDASAKDKAQKLYADLAAELKGQDDPKIDDPRLERFTLYDGDRVVCEVVSARRS